MAKEILNTALFRICLPALILFCVIVRPCLISAVYLLVSLCLPFIPSPTTENMSGRTGVFLKILIALSVISNLAQITFHITMVAILGPYGHLNEDKDLEILLKQIGFMTYDHLKPWLVAMWCLPDFLMLVVSVIFFVLFRKLNAPSEPDEAAPSSEEISKSLTNIEKTYISHFVAIGRFCVLALLCTAGVLRPSAQGGLYYVVFLCCATWWACCKQLRKGFAIALCLLMPLMVAHLGCLYAYQFEWPQSLLPFNGTYARVFGMTRLASFDTTPGVNGTVPDPRVWSWDFDQEWVSFLNPIVLYMLFYVSVLTVKELFKPEQKKQGPFSRLEGSFQGPLGRQMSQRLSKQQLIRNTTPKKRWQSATRKVRENVASEKSDQSGTPGENTPLIRGVSPSKRSNRKSGIYQDSTGSVTFTANTEDIPLDNLDDDEEDYLPTLLENVILALDSILQLIVRSSYIATNIIMMAWSITYLSWLTFVLLIWANLMWLVPKQRRTMLRSSPFLVIYAWFLLLSAYVYSMNLTEDELPSSVKGVNFAEIGFVKVTVFPCVPLLVKTLYTVMFWITLRQFMQERLEERQTSALADMVAPLQVTVRTATGVNNEREKSGVKVMELIGNTLMRFLTRMWIWIVAITLFGVAITGQRMTGFRILYMALFLVFVITFQFSFRVWRKLMFGFWLTVIIYSMIILVLVYTYQFKNFPHYWTEYLHIPEKIQLDIGLEQFETKQLFVRLVTPTFFVIITVIQLHYFHRDFMALSDPKNTTQQTQQQQQQQNVEELEQSSMQGGAEMDQSMKEDPSSSLQFDLYTVEHISSEKLRILLHRFLNFLYKAKNLMFLFLEIHMIKFVLLIAMLACINDKCTLYFLVVVLLALACTFGRPMQLIAVYTSSLLMSVLLLVRMIYQIQYITPDNWNVTCKYSNNYTINNDALWLGLQKESEAGESLPSLVKWNIIYIVTVTLWTVVLVRQYNYRASRGRPTTRAFFMFPSITRPDADKDLVTCLKYMANYGFYKFGLEVCLITIVALIGVRLDLYAIIHALWLCAFIAMRRSILSRIWVIYMIFIAVSLPFQYFMSVGLPPSLCQEFPWDNSTETWENLQDWAFLMSNFDSPIVMKILCDFILLLMVSRQWVVFRIERRYPGMTYAGGSNESIIHHAEEVDFKNPVPDFITYVRSYLDIVKRCVLQSFLWTTLALVFLAGTNRINMYSLGYLLFAFVFLWHGSDIYLKPIPRILRQWQWLINYNVCVILIKSCFQLWGCVFTSYVPFKFCWILQVLGVGCLKKFDSNFYRTQEPTEDSCFIPTEGIGISWDGLCFGFLIFQRKIFNSYNFFHIINDTKATAILASRGAELIEEMRQKTMQDQEEDEKKILEKIKLKMDRIKANQLKIQARPDPTRSSSATSCASSSHRTSTPAGYHTPINEEDEEEEEQEETTTAPPTTNQPQQAPPSPYSAVMTVSLEGYLEPQRMSFSSPPNSEFNPSIRRAASPDESFPVFSPPPYEEEAAHQTTDTEEPVSELPTAIEMRRRSGIGPPWLQGGSCVTPRQSVISYSSRSPLSHHEYSICKNRPKYRVKPPVTYKEAVRSGDYYMFDEMEDDEIDLLPTEKSDDEEFDGGTNRLDMGQLLSTALKTDMDTAIRKHSSVGALVRQHSMPVSRQKPPRSHISSAFSAPPTIEEHESRTVRIQVTDSEPQPGTSKDEDFSELTEPKDNLGRKLLRFFLFLWAFIESAMVSLTKFLNSYSKNYRYVLKVLGKEKRILKERTSYTVGVRMGSNGLWQPAGSYHSLLRQSMEDSLVFSPPTSELFSPPDSYRIALGLTRMSSTRNSETSNRLPLSEDSDTKIVATSLPYFSEQDRSKKTTSQTPYSDSEGEEMSSYEQPTIFRLLLAIWYIIMSRSELLCYFVIFLNQIKTATILSLPLPMMVFCWGSLTIPRPSKTFWITIIAYTEVIVMLKCIFQFDIMPGNKTRAKTEYTYSTESVYMHPAVLFGLHRQHHYATWDLLLLLVVFFHRVLLKSMGLWSNSISVPAAMLPDGEYVLEGAELIPLEEHSTKSETASTSSKTKDKSRKTSTPTPDKRSDKSSLDVDLFEIQTRPIVPIDRIITAIKMSIEKYAQTFKEFNRQLMDPTSRIAADVYFMMFFCDFFNFFVLLFGYSSFGSQQDGGVQSYLEDNRVPPLFLFMLILQFMIIIIDRGIYLRKNIFVKIVFQYVQVILLHLWLFALFPVITNSVCNTVLPPQIYYMVKCFYLLLSAFQIRCGYPTRILGNFLCKGYGFINMVLFRGFMLVPFLFELRTCMDWMWTETSMTMFDWIKMEDIFQHIFLIKCSRHMEEEYPQPRGEKKKPLMKYIMGGFGLVAIIGIIWFPLVFFSLGNAVGKPNVPYEVSVEVRIGKYEPVYRMAAQSNSIYSFTESEFTSLQSRYNGHKASETFLYNYEPADVAAVKLSTDSSNIWSISPPDRDRMVEEINSTKPLTVTLDYSVSHKTSKAEDSGVLHDQVTIVIPPANNETDEIDVRANLLKMLEKHGNGTVQAADPVLLEFILPKFLKVTNRGTAEPVDDLMLEFPDLRAKTYRNITLILHPSADKEYWTVRETCTDRNYLDFLESLPYEDCPNSLIIYTFNDKIFPPSLNIITGGGIIGLYTTIVFVASRVLRGLFADQCSKIMFEELPFVDRVLQLCLDVYLVREACEFALEEDLFAKLVFLFRSPETLVKWTRPPEELEEGEDDENPEGDEHPGIIGMYMVYFFLVHGLLRDAIMGVSDIWLDEMPDVDILYKKCLEVYLCRDMGCFFVEAELLEDLMLTMRSSEMAIKCTRYTFRKSFNPTFCLVFEELKKDKHESGK